MPIDVSILRQQAPMQMPSLMESRARANQLMASDAQLAANALQLQRAQREEQQAQDINKLYSLPGAVSPTGELDYGVIGQAAPGMGLARLLPELNKQRLAEMKARGEAGKASYEQAKARDEAINQRLKMYQEKYRFVTTPEAALAMHDQVHSDPVLQNFFDEMGVDAAQGRKRIEESIANGTFPQFLQEQSASLEQVRGQRAIQTAINAANEKFGTTTTPDGRTMRVGFDRKGYAVEVTENLSKQGFPDLAKQYLEQQLEMAKLKYAGLPASAAEAAAFRDNPELFEIARRLKEAGANRQTVSVGGQVYKTELAKETVEIVRNAPKAVQALEKAKATLDLLKRGKANTGFAAQLRTDIGRAVALFSKRAPESVTETETLQALLGSDVFPMIQSLGIGARGLDTPAERDFLLKVMTGSIELDNTTLQELTRIRARVFQRAIDEYNERLRNGEFDDYMSETKRTLKPIKAPPLDEEAAPVPPGAQQKGEERLKQIFKSK